LEFILIPLVDDLVNRILITCASEIPYKVEDDCKDFCLVWRTRTGLCAEIVYEFGV
jgi:hypothetical protein